MYFLRIGKKKFLYRTTTRVLSYYKHKLGTKETIKMCTHVKRLAIHDGQKF